jgi:shikimate dehydrogenase
MKLSGHTTPFAVLGHPIGHTLSPVMHNASLQSLGMDAIYLAFDVDPSRLINVLHSMGDMGFGGVNLTVPLKEVAFNSLSLLDDSARTLGAVNTVEYLDNGDLKGHNTDGAGFLLALREAFEEEIKSKSVFILGSGGAGRALAITCAGQGARRITVTDSDPVRPPKVAAEIGRLSPEVPVTALPADRNKWKEASLEADLVVQATPVGMKQDDDPLLKSEAFRKGQMVYDLIYMYRETGLLSRARKSGARVSNGLGMLLHQGAHSFTIWTGKQADTAAMRRALEESVYR